MIEDIKTAATNIGITAVITNSTQRIETQLNSITRLEELPIMLVSWDLDSELSFDVNGLLENPKTKVVCLLMGKAENFKDDAEDKAVEMFGLFQKFLQELRSILVQHQTNFGNQPITGAGAKLVPIHGSGKHSGVLGRFTMSTEVVNCEV